MHGGGHLVGARELLASAFGHQAGDGVELAAGAVQLDGALLEAVEGIGEEIAQGVGGHGQAAQFVLATGIHALAEVALAELGDVLDQ
ncbi:hypothetical protein D9M69_661760 [compost metagenome]